MSNKIFSISTFLFVIVFTPSCKKFLDTKSNQILSTPSTLKDLQGLLDVPNFYRRGLIITNTSSDEYHLPFANWQNQQELRKKGYIWDPETDDINDWINQYQNILYTNTVLDNWDNIVNNSPDQQANDIKGSALFLRAHSFFHLAQIFAPQFDSATASSDLGIVLRMDSDFNTPSTRSTVQQTYDQIIGDLQEATSLLSSNSAYNTRPNKASVFALLARTYLQVGNYTKAMEAANNCLQIYNYLIDYNDPAEIDTLSNESILQINKNNKEIIFLLNDDGSINSTHSDARVDSNLYKSYDANDIRKAAFFRVRDDTSYLFKGSYNGSLTMGAFVGLGTAEVYLIRAEANARLGNINAALQDINDLLIKRYRSGTFVPVTAATSEEATNITLLERRKEMVYRGVRWSDLRRLNKESSRSVILKRVLDGQEYTLPPNDHRYTLLIPREIIKETGLPQNPR